MCAQRHTTRMGCSICSQADMRLTEQDHLRDVNVGRHGIPTLELPHHVQDHWIVRGCLHRPTDMSGIALEP